MDTPIPSHPAPGADTRRGAHVTEFGGPTDAPALLLVHGLGSSSLAWTALARALVPSYRVLAVDLPGHGRTPAGGRPFSVSGAADVVLGAAEDAGHGRVTLVGHSLGAAVSILAATRAPARVERMMLLAPPLPRAGLPSIGPAVLPPLALCLWPALGRRVLRHRIGGRAIEDLVAERLPQASLDPSESAELVAAMAADLRSAIARGEDPLTCFLDAARAIGILVTSGDHYRVAIGEVRAPVHVVHGERDRVLRAGALRQLERLQPGWRTHVLPDVGHSPHLETPLTVARLITDLMATTGAGNDPPSGPPHDAGLPLRQSA